MILLVRIIVVDNEKIPVVDGTPRTQEGRLQLDSFCVCDHLGKRLRGYSVRKSFFFLKLMHRAKRVSYTSCSFKVSRV